MILCRKCRKEPSELNDCIEDAKTVDCNPSNYVKEYDCTYDREGNTFLCMDCFLEGVEG